MTNQIKNFIEEGEKLKEEYNNFMESPAIENDWDSVKDGSFNWWIEKFSSRQISLIKMIVEMVESEKKEKMYRSDGKTELFITAHFHHNQALDIISSKLKDLYER